MFKKKIVFITGEFIPYTQSIGGVIRVISYLRSLKKQNLTLISVKKKFYGYFGFKSNMKNIERIYLNSEKIYGSKWSYYILTLLKLFFSNIFYILGVDNNYFKSIAEII